MQFSASQGNNSHLFPFFFADEGSVKHYECECDGSSCSNRERCYGQQCFTSLSTLNGTSVLQKGCVVDNGDVSLSCGAPPTPELAVECCHGDLCNMNVSLQLPVRGEVVAFRAA